MASSSRKRIPGVSTNESTDTLTGMEPSDSKQKAFVQDNGLNRQTSDASTPSYDATVTYGRHGIAGIFSNKYVVLCCAFASIGGMFQYLTASS
jgi:hypothetical protein